MFLRRLVWVVLLALFSVTAQARLLVLASQDSPLYRSFQQGLEAELVRSGLTQEQIFTLASDYKPGKESSSADVIVAAGVEAAKRVAEIDIGESTVIYTMLPLSSYHWLEHNNMLAQRHQVLFIDQPASRYVKLAKAALPEVQSLGYFHGEVSDQHIADLQQGAAENRLTLNAVSFSPKQRLSKTLEQLVQNNDAVLVLPDPYLFNRRTMQSLLLATVRGKTPLIAYSESFVKAGALLGLFSSPNEIGRQTAEIIVCQQQECDGDIHHFPKYFSVRVNELIARRLGLELSSEEALAKRLDSAVGRH